MREMLPSWRPGAAKTAILDFLWGATASPAAVDPAERIATFDNDGTLACEKPRTALAAFLAEQAPDAPARASGHEVLRELAALFAGQTTADYESRSREFLHRATHPRFDCGYPSLVYAPMRELIGLLTRLEFSVYLCSDSSRDFNRVLAGPAYGLARDRVIGSEVQIELQRGQLIRTGVPNALDDGPGKAVHIWDRTGYQPLFAAGNATGDIEMLSAARFALLVHHDDPDREYAYDDEPALAAATAARWTVASMREDFATVWAAPADVT
jgi:phosphoserine phosphatase